MAQRNILHFQILGGKAWYIHTLYYSHHDFKYETHVLSFSLPLSISIPTKSSTNMKWAIFGSIGSISDCSQLGTFSTKTKKKILALWGEKCDYACIYAHARNAPSCLPQLCHPKKHGFVSSILHVGYWMYYIIRCAQTNKNLSHSLTLQRAI